MKGRLKQLWGLSPEEISKRLRLRFQARNGGVDKLSIEDYFKLVPNALSWERHHRNFLKIEEMARHRYPSWKPFDFENSVFLEVGSGLAGGLAPVALFRGARKALLVEPLWREGAFESSELGINYFRPMWNMLTMVYGERMSFEAWMNRLVKDTEVHAGGMDSASFSMAPDICWSLSCLEHIPNLSDSIERLREVCKDSAVRQIHAVDFGNHLSKDKPFLEMYDRSRSEVQSKASAHINCLRASDVQSLLERAGWNCQQLRMTMAPLNREGIQQSWLDHYSEETLETRVAAFFCS